METLPQDIWVSIAEKAVEDPDSLATTLQSLRLVNKRFRAAVEQAAFACNVAKLYKETSQC